MWGKRAVQGGRPPANDSAANSPAGWSPAQGEPLLRVRGLRKTYDTVEAVQSLDFEVMPGETVVLIGASGSGKTTVLRMLNRLIAPTSGEVWFQGLNTRQWTPEVLRRQMGYVIQQGGLFPHRRVWRNVATVPRLLGWSRSREDQRIRHLLELVGLPAEEFGSRYPHQLSGGQQQRVSIARALAAEPALVLLDEPFGALDPITRAQLRADFRSLQQQSGLSAVLVTHDLAEAVELGDRILLMNEGQLQQAGSAQDLLFRPANSYVREFFNSQRFELELQVLTLGRIQELSQAQQGREGWLRPPSAEPHLQFSLKKPVYAVLAAASRHPHPNPRIALLPEPQADPAAPPQAETTQEDLLAEVQRTINQLKSGDPQPPLSSSETPN